MELRSLWRSQWGCLMPKNPYHPLGSSSSRPAHHGACAEHVRVDGLRDPVCVRKGDDRDRVVNEAMELAGIQLPDPRKRLGDRWE